MKKVATMEFKEINFASTPVKRIRFRGDSLASDGEPLLQTEYDEDVSFKRNSEQQREGLFTIFLSAGDTQSLIA